ncbi:hypothetical protein B0J13DRAFT_517999 [Dactylonectria estremocensis]|uniref:BTB domain-containing protein n=1 Tax=Dactylonectria estremocensis TaxID=1079267 RepID=A0A9P9JIJ7_9HYPO|nr:hypothetical protein B0J13DRAFT_517999 [Dactylonectria estremocensis]
MAQRGGESSGGADMAMHTLAEAMNGPSIRPDVVVLNSTYQQDIDALNLKEKPLNAAEDLWLTTADGRYSSPPIPIRVGSLQDCQTFYVHKDILLKVQWFRSALCGSFREADEQIIDLPEEEPSVFHHLVTFLYEDRYHPIMPAAQALNPTPDKGKGRALGSEAVDGSDSASLSSSSGSSHHSDNSGWRWAQRQNRARGAVDTGAVVADTSRDKQFGVHRPGCQCPGCAAHHNASRCWQCGAPPLRNTNNHNYRPRPHPHPHPGARMIPNQQRPRGSGNNAALALPANDSSPRIQGEDMRTWLMAYELNLDVYICANRYLMDGFRNAVMRSCIDMLETAGADAAHPRVLRLCLKLVAGVPENDPLLKMVLARVGFLQPALWKRAPAETTQFLVENPELAASILRETVMRHEATFQRQDLPSMENA